MASAFFRAFNGTISQLYKLADGSGSVDAVNAPFGNLMPSDLTEFSGSVWFGGNTASQGRQLYKLLPDPATTSGFSATQITFSDKFGNDLNPDDLTMLGSELWFAGNTATRGRQLYKLGDNGNVTLWTDLNPTGGGLDPTNLTVFSSSHADLWFNGKTATQGRQLFVSDNFTGTVTMETDIAVSKGGLDPVNFSAFGNNLWFSGNTESQGRQLYRWSPAKSDLFQWTATDNLSPSPLVEFNGKAWFAGDTGGPGGRELYQLAPDPALTFSVTQWSTNAPQDPTRNNPVSNVGSNFLTFNNALWFTGTASNGQGVQLYKLGSDGSVTKWTSPTSILGGLTSGFSDPTNMFVFNGSLWFNGNTPSGRQLFKMGSDEKVYAWTLDPGGFNPQLVSMAANDSDSTPSSIFNNAAWLQGTNHTNTAGIQNTAGTELYKLGADNSVTLWKDINPGTPSSFPTDWARFA